MYMKQHKNSSVIEEISYDVQDTNAHALSIIFQVAPQLISFIGNFVNLTRDNLHLFDTATELNVEAQSPALLKNVVNLKRLNDMRHINRFIVTVNTNLESGGIYIGCFESKAQRKARIFGKFPYLLAALFYYLLDVPWKRIIPKIPYIKVLYFGLTKGHNRVISRVEVLGRLVASGFRIRDYKEAGGLTYFAAEKIGAPDTEDKPTYGAIASLKRIGREGKVMKYYKFRTMYPYSEYLQDYVYQLNGISNGDKIDEDFRITRWGHWLRRYWLDELPMLVNWLKGDVKLVGVRPISRHKFGTYPQWLRDQRITHKPGLIPPFYADLPETIEEFIDSEKKYLDAYERSPLRTDIKYFFWVLFNIVFRGARSR